MAAFRSAFWGGSTSGPLLVCCLSLPRGKKGKCKPPTDVGPFAINVTCYYVGEVIHIQKEEFSEILSQKKRSNLGSCGTFRCEFWCGSIFLTVKLKEGCCSFSLLSRVSELPGLGCSAPVSQPSRRALLGSGTRESRLSPTKCQALCWFLGRQTRIGPDLILPKTVVQEATQACAK